MVMGDEPTAIGTRYIASVGLHEAIVELRRDGWHRGVFNDETRNWEVPPSWVEVPSTVESTVRTTSKIYTGAP